MAARKSGGGETHPRWSQDSIPVVQGSWSMMVASRSFLMRGRSCGGGLQALGRGGVAWPGWSKAFAPAEQWGGEG